MKTIKKFLVLCLILSAFAVANSQAQIVVRARIGRPAGRHYRPARPSAAHVWVSEEYEPSGNTYAYHDGYWAVPPRHGAQWVPGHWVAHRDGHGYVWAHGYWR
jgi:hypothetical protein